MFSPFRSFENKEVKRGGGCLTCYSYITTQILHPPHQTSFPPEEGGGMPAYFAFLTVLSVNVFVSEGVDVAIMEVSLMGE